MWTPDIQHWVMLYGMPALGVFSFLAATLLPFSSEAALVAALAAGIPASKALIACSIGNCSACLLNYALGRRLHDSFRLRLERSRTGRIALRWAERYGIWSLFLSWLPGVGDPLTIVAGGLRVSLAWFILIVFTLRVLRYVLIVVML